MDYQVSVDFLRDGWYVMLGSIYREASELGESTFATLHNELEFYGPLLTRKQNYRKINKLSRILQNTIRTWTYLQSF